MANICGECAKLDLSNKEKYSSVDRYWCTAGHGYRELTERACNYDFYYDPEKGKKPNEGYTPSGCPITAIICHLLGYSDDCELLNTLREFRENFLKTHKEYLNLLVEYDVYGPEISQKIQLEDKDHRLSLSVLYNYLFPLIENIRNKNYNLAIQKYKLMVNFLLSWFNIERTDLSENMQNIDMTTLGKGRTRAKMFV